ncbi:MAG: zinc-ribbon domain-containing protein, partial [Mailhella sp.]|nr:zinc-ribbon domain-containing protein [Mailhella sp.]
MKIQCPSCRFERVVPVSSVRPGKTYMVTCPLCSAVFHFSRPE